MGIEEIVLPVIIGAGVAGIIGLINNKYVIQKQYKLRQKEIREQSWLDKKIPAYIELITFRIEFLNEFNKIYDDFPNIENVMKLKKGSNIKKLIDSHNKKRKAFLENQYQITITNVGTKILAVMYLLTGVEEIRITNNKIVKARRNIIKFIENTPLNEDNFSISLEEIKKLRLEYSENIHKFVNLARSEMGMVGIGKIEEL